MSLLPDNPDHIGDEIERINEILADAEGPNGMDLTDREQEFCDSMRERVEQYGRRTFISDKQMEVLDRIEAKLSGMED